MSHPDRDTLFANEKFIIGVLQIVSAGLLVGSVNQFDKLWPFIGDVPFMVFLTVEGFALGVAVFAALAKHQYKMWDVKGERDAANKWLNRMRRAMYISTAAILGGLALFIAAAWVNGY